MADRKIANYLGGNTGATLERYAWRSKATHSPLTGRPVRCVVAQDEKGRYWSGARIGPGNGEKGRNEFWIEPFAGKEQAIREARSMTRDFLAHECELYSGTVKNKNPGEKIIEVTMDDGWRVGINAAGRVSPEKRRVMAQLDRLGKQERPKSPAKSRDCPSR